MKKRVVILVLTLVFLAGAMAAAGLPLESRAVAAEEPKPTETPAATSMPPAPTAEAAEPLDGLGALLERLAQDYDPASGAVGAFRWAESILVEYLTGGRCTDAAETAGEEYAARYGENDAALQSRLAAVRKAAEALTSGQELSLVRDRRLLAAEWDAGEVDALFAAIAAGAGMV